MSLLFFAPLFLRDSVAYTIPIPIALLFLLQAIELVRRLGNQVPAPSICLPPLLLSLLYPPLTHRFRPLDLIGIEYREEGTPAAFFCKAANQMLLSVDLHASINILLGY